MKLAATAALIALALAAPRALAAGPTTLPSADAERLRAALPVVRSADPVVKSIHIRVRTLGDIDGIKINVVKEGWYQAPGSYASRNVDGIDGTPIFAAAAGHGGLVYDALDQYVLLIPTGTPAFKFGGEGPVVTVRAGIAEGDRVPPSPVVVDLRSLFPTDGGRTVAEDLGDGSRRLTHIADKGSRTSAVIRPDGTVTDITLADQSGNTVFKVEAFEVDAPIPAAAFDLPSRDVLAAVRLKTAEAGDDIATGVGMVRMVMKDMAVRAAAHNPALRERFKFVVPADTDWSRVAAEDAKASAALRELLAGPPSGGAKPGK